MPIPSGSFQEPNSSTGLANKNTLGAWGGLHLHFPTFALLNAAVATERTNHTAGNDRWDDEQPMTYVGGVGTRKWSLSGQHARNVTIPGGKVITLAADSNTVGLTTGAPTAGNGTTTNDGNYLLDQATNLLYGPKATNWPAGVSLVVGASSAPNKTYTTPEALYAAAAASALTSGTTYELPSGWRYYAVSTSKFYPASVGAPHIVKDTTSAIGDSISANSYASSNPTNLSFLAWASSQLPVPFNIVASRGVGGYAIATITSTSLSATLADASDIVWLHGGVNNLRYANATATSLEQAVIDFTALISSLSAGKRLVIADSVNPEMGAGDGYRNVEIPHLNRLFAGVCAQYPNVIFNDIYTSYLDPASSTPTPDVTCVWDSLIHPNTKGAYQGGMATADNLRAKVYLIPSWQVVTNVAIPDFSGSGGTSTGGGITGTIPAGILVQNAGSAAANTTIVVTPKTYTSTKNAVNITAANTSTTASSFVGAQFSNNAAYNASFVAGDLVRCKIKARVKSQVNCIRFEPYLYINASIKQSGLRANTSVETPNIVLPSKAFDGTFYSPPIVLPAGFTSIDVVMSIQLGTSSSVDFDVIDWTLEKVAAV